MTTLRTRSIALALACALGLPHAAAAAPVTITAADQRDVMITVYNGNLGLVKETREVRLDSGLVEAPYLTGGISWKSDYVMLINASDTRTDLTSWVTITNQSGGTYRDAALKLVAGDINRAVSRDEARRALEMSVKAASPAMADRDFKSEGFFEYHLYTLDGRTTIKDNQTKQLTLLSATDVPVKKELIYYGAQEYYRNAYGMPVSNQKVAAYLEIGNTKENRLGLPLPKGKVRVYKADSAGSQQFIGEDWIDHTAKDERGKIKLGNAFDLVA